MRGQQFLGRDAYVRIGSGGVPSRVSQLIRPPAFSHYYTRRALPQPIGSLDLCLLHFAASFVPGPLWQLVRGGPLTTLAATVGAGLFLFPMTLAAAKLMALAPAEGALYSWTVRLLGPYWGAVVGISDWLPGLLAAVSALMSFVVTLQSLKAGWLVEPWQRGLVILVLLILLLLLGWQRQRTVQRVVNALSALMLIIVALSGICSLVLLQQRAWSLPPSWRSGWPADRFPHTPASLTALLYLGYGAPLSMAGELRPGLTPGRPLLGSALLLSGSYLLLAISALLAPDGEPGLVLEMALGHPAGSLALVGLLAFYLCVAFVHTAACARLLLVAALDGLVPTKLAWLNQQRIPWRAFAAQTLLAGLLTTLFSVLLPQMHLDKASSFIALPLLLATMALLRMFVAFFCLYILILASYYGSLMTPDSRVASPWWLWPTTVAGVAGSTLVALGILTSSWTPMLPDATWTLLAGILILVCLGTATMAALPATAHARRLGPHLLLSLQEEETAQPQEQASVPT
ncbi:amino acid permease [Thermogemmatispora sp.]|uniref:amino acid permease n=1 Tax=Thermogemmatispora sp. TaxID=1968838 RepID=UPI001D57C752|nr:amino acid permease [Thermogemmatispora sp.]MBX5448690.1 APC family permease [Thermogemmatispora sp.]